MTSESPLNHPFTIRNFHQVHRDSDKYSQALAELLGDPSHGYSGFDAFLVARWTASYVKEVAARGKGVDLAVV